MSGQKSARSTGDDEFSNWLRAAGDRRLARLVRRVIRAMFVMAVACCCGETLAEELTAEPQIVSLRAGFDGCFKLGCWTPMEVTVRGGERAVRVVVELTVLDGDGVPSRVRAAEGGDEGIEIAPGATVKVSLYAKLGQITGDAIVVLRAGEQVLATRTFGRGAGDALAGMLPSDQSLIVTLGRPLSEADMAALEARRTKVVQLSDPDELPGEWWGLETVDTLIVATADEAGRRMTADSQQMAALDRWVRMGGKLILSVGQQAETVLAAGSALARLAPGTFQAMVPLRQSASVEMYVETSEALSTPGGAFVVQVPKLVDARGRIEAYAGGRPRDLPLVVRSPHGFGEVVFLAFDLDRSPLVNWPARGQLLEKLLRAARPRESEGSTGTLGQVTTLGFNDLAGQLRGALDQFPGVWLVPFWFVALLIVVYIAVVGPLDFLFVKRVLRRMEATWLTFALAVVLFSAGAYALAYSVKGRELRLNQVDLVDYDAASNLVRGTSWLNLFSPKAQTFDLALRPAPPGVTSSVSGDVIFSWIGLSGSGFGGMDSVAGAVPLFDVPYDFDRRLDAMRGVPIATWSSKALVGRWWTEAAPGVEGQLSETGKLTGTLRSHLDVPLENCVLFYDRWAYPLRQLRPGAQVDIETQLDAQTVDTYLRHVTVQQDRSVAPPYDRASFDVPRIVEIMTLHELAGGSNYTSLSAQYQGFVELSSLVRDGRAVLVGRATEPGSELVSDSAAKEAARQHWTFCRFVFPVERPDEP